MITNQTVDVKRKGKKKRVEFPSGTAGKGSSLSLLCLRLLLWHGSLARSFAPWAWPKRKRKKKKKKKDKQEFFFGHAHGMKNFLGQGVNPHHSSDLSQCSDNTRSLTP